MGTHQLTRSFQDEIPQNSLERILENSGQFGGQEAAIGGAFGGLPGAGIGLAHGSVSGALYGGLKELGVDDNWALGITALASLSPIAARKLYSKYKPGTSVKKAAQSIESQFPLKNPAPTINIPHEGGPPPSGPPVPGAIVPGATLPQGTSNFPVKEAVVAELSNPITQLERPLGTSEVRMAPRAPIQTQLEERRPEYRENALTHAVTPQNPGTEFHEGTYAHETVQANAANDRIPVTEAYNIAREAAQGSMGTHAQLAAYNDALIDELQQVARRNSGQDAVLRQAEGIRELIGTTEGLIQANAGQLIAQSDAMSQLVNYEFPYVGYKGRLRSLVRQVNDSVINSMRNQHQNFRALQEADQLYSQWADRYLGDEISPFLERNVRNPEALFRKAVSDEGTYRALRAAMGPQQRPYMDRLDAAIIEKRLSNYFKNPEKVGDRHYNAELRNLNDLLQPENVHRADVFLRRRRATSQAAKRTGKAVKEGPRRKLAERITGATQRTTVPSPTLKTPEQLDKLLSSRSGIRELRNDLTRRGQKALFDEVAENKIKEIFKEGTFGERKLTGKDLIRIIDKEHEVLIELMGEEGTAALYKVGKIAKDEELTEELIKKILKSVGKTALTAAGLGKLAKFITHL